jgi:hypothetical protein
MKRIVFAALIGLIGSAAHAATCTGITLNPISGFFDCAGSGGGGAGVASAVVSFSAETSKVITHNFNLTTTDAFVHECKDAGGNTVTGGTFSSYGANSVTLTFTVAQTATCVLLSSGSTGGGGGGLGDPGANGIVKRTSLNVTTIAVAGTDYFGLQGTANLNFPNIVAGTCAAELTFTLTGAVAGRPVAPGWPAVTLGLIGQMRASATNTIAVTLCNFTGSDINPAALDFYATI